MAHHFGGEHVTKDARDIFCRALDTGITHFDLASNYGMPPGSAEINFGRLLSGGFKHYRNEIVIATKAGYQAWKGPYGGGGSRKHIRASIDLSLRRLNIDYVDIFYSHCPDTTTPLEETLGALADTVERGKALYVGLSSYSPELTVQAITLLREWRLPCTIHQPSYSMLNRWIEAELLDVLADNGIGCIAFAVLAQGLLAKSVVTVPGRSGPERRRRPFGSENLARAAALNLIANRRGQTIEQLAIAWALRDPRITSVLIGVRSVDQLNELLASVKQLHFSQEELTEIDAHAVNGHINYWQSPYNYAEVTRAQRNPESST
jgi:L-glyceraldehyde 3-phosphate reductase